MIGFAAEKLMALEVGTKTGAGYGEKNGFRLVPCQEASATKHNLVPMVSLSDLRLRLGNNAIVERDHRS
jgi:hypothetical protein